LWLVHLAHLQLKQTRSDTVDAEVKTDYHKAFLVFTYLILPSTAAKIFQVFSCQDVDPDNDVSGDDEYMTIDYSVSCSSSKYHFGFVWAIASILVYPVGIPAYYFYVLYTSKKLIQNCGDTSLSLPSTKSDEYLQSILLLFEAYEPQYWYWEVIETIRRLMLTGVLVLIAQGSAVQIVAGIVFAIFFLMLYDSYSPFVDPIIGQFEAVSQRQIVSVFFLALLVKANFGSITTATLDVFLVFAIFANMGILFCKWVVWWCSGHTSGINMKRKHSIVGNELVVSVLPQMSPVWDEESKHELEMGGVDEEREEYATAVLSGANQPSEASEVPMNTGSDSEYDSKCDEVVSGNHTTTPNMLSCVSSPFTAMGPNGGSKQQQQLL
jgi:hypothetical protein